MLCKLQSQSKLLGHFAVQWRIQGRGQGEPGSPLIFKPNWGPKGRKKFFDTIPPRPLISGSGWPLPPPPAPHLIWRSGSAIAVFLPSQCWYTRFGELTAINKIGRTRRWARSWKNSVGWKFSNYFCRRLALDTIQNSDNERWNYCVVGCSYSMKMNDTTLLRQLTMISTDPCRHNLKTLFLFWSQNFI